LEGDSDVSGFILDGGRVSWRGGGMPEQTIPPGAKMLRLLPALLLPIGLAGAAIEPPALVEYRLPWTADDEAWMISVRYAADGTSVVESHAAANTPMVAPANDDSKYLPGAWIAGPMTGSRAGRIQNWEDEIGTNFIEVTEAPALRPETRYVDERLTEATEEPGRPSWSVDGIRVSVEGDGTVRRIEGLNARPFRATLSWNRNRFEADGRQSETERRTHVFRIWLSEELPFSPLPFLYEPFQGNRAPPYVSGPVAERVMAELVDQLRGRGGLVRAEVVGGEKVPALEIVGFRETPPPPMEKFEALPVVPGRQVNAFAGPMFLASLLRDDMVRSEEDATLWIGDREVPATAAWKTNEADDLVVAITAKNENTTLFLLRPTSGLPGPGEYGTAVFPGRDGWKEMSAAEREEHLGRFQLYGVVTGDSLPAVLSGFAGGAVEIESAGEGEALVGKVQGSATVLRTESLSEPGEIEVDAEFEADPGLEKFRFRSNESRL
jgi:hypothetical protein